MLANKTTEPAGRVKGLLFAAEAAFRARRMGEVEHCCEEILELDRNHVLALHLVRLAINAKGDLDQELRILRRIVAINPDHPESLNGLADVLRKQGQPLLGIEPCLHAVGLRPDCTNAHNTLGLCYFETGALTQAAECFERAIRLQPTLAAAYVNLGATLKKLGRTAEAVDCYCRATQIAPDSSEAQEALGLLYGLQKKPQHAAQCFRRVLRLNPTSSRAHLLLADSLHQQGFSDKAAELVDRALAGEMSYWDDIGVTMPTRLIGLAADKPAARAAAEEYLRRTRLIDPEARFIVNKFNDNIFHVGFLHLVFPNARFIHCRRSPIDNCVSIYMTPFRKRSPAFRVREDILEIHRHFSTLASHWRQVLPPDRFLEVDYEESIANHEEVTRRIIAFCDLEWEDACLRHEENKRIVNTPSKWQARQPIYSTSVERWRRYEPWLGAFEELIPKNGSAAAGLKTSTDVPIG